MPNLTFDYARESARVRQVLKSAFGPNAAIRTDPGEGGQVYVRLVSDRFDGVKERAKQDMIWDVLKQELREDAQAVALVLAFGTDQL